MYSTLFYFIQSLVSLKSTLSQKVSKEEQKIIDKIYFHSSLPKELSRKIKWYIIDAKIIVESKI